MAVVNVGLTITSALTKLAGNLPRAQFVSWFNEIVQDILRQPRDWKFLEEPLSLPITANTVTLPDGVSEVVSIEAGAYFYTPKNLLSDEEANTIDNAELELLSQDTEGLAPGYTLDPTGKIITFHPAITGVAAASVVVMQDVTTAYVDNQNTIFPFAFSNLFITGLRMHYYDFDKDGRFTKENMQYQIEMSKVKAWDNRRKAQPKYNRRGYIRGTP